MDWFLLIVVLPLILIPIVLLLGFAGCATFGEEPTAAPPPTPPPATAPPVPSGLTATAISSTEIELRWNDSSAGAVNFEVHRQKNSPGVPVVTLPVAKGTAQPVVDKGLSPASSYTYTVRAVDPSTGLSSGYSSPVTATTAAAPIWQTAFTMTLTNDDVDRRGHCLVQRIAAGALMASGQRIRVTLRSSNTTGLAIDRLSVSNPCQPEPGNMTPNAWDSPTTGLTDLRPGGVYLAKNSSRELEEVNFPVDLTKDLLIAFDIGSATGVLRKAIAAQNAYDKAATAEASVANRSAAYTTLPGVFLIEKIEVFPTKQPTPTLTWVPTFSQALGANTGNRASGCLVQRITAAKLSTSGNKVRLTLRAGSGGPLAIRRIFISRAAVAGEPGNPTPNPWDSTASDIVEVHPGGASIPANTAVTLAPFNYVVDKSKDLMIAFDISEFAGECRQGALTGPAFYFKANIEEAGVANRAAGYTTSNDLVCLVEKIEVGS